LAEEPHLVRNRRGDAQAQARCGARPRSRCSGPKKLIEQAYTLGAQLGLSVWCEDEAGPFQAGPHPGASWRPRGEPATRPHEHIRGGATKILTLFHPASGRVRLQSAARGTNAVPHPWLRERLSAILAELPPRGPSQDPAATRAAWAVWQEGLRLPVTLPHDLPPLRLLLVWDDLAGHKTPDLVLWLCAHGVMPLYTPVGGSWLNMAESIERVLKRRALDGQHPHSPEEIGGWFEQTARAWNEQPTPFVWNGKRRQRRRRSYGKPIHRIGGSGACAERPIRRTQATTASECQTQQQMTH
jgi:transposase